MAHPPVLSSGPLGRGGATTLVVCSRVDDGPEVLAQVTEDPGEQPRDLHLGDPEVVGDPHDLAGRAHLGAEDGVHTGEAAEGQHRSLHRDVPEPLVARGVPPQRRNAAGKLRSSFVQPYNCDTVLIQGVTLRHSLFWQLHPTLCRHVTVDGVTTHHSGVNSDGCDPECCDHVVIKNSTLLAGDDNIAIKSGRDADGRRVNVPTQNVVIWNNQFEGKYDRDVRELSPLLRQRCPGVPRRHCSPAK